MNREEALKFVCEKIKNPNLVKHSLAVEAIMKALARHFTEDENLWSLTGLLHDIDYEETKKQPEEHSLKGAEFLKELGLSPELVQAVRTHNEIHGFSRISLLEKCLYAVDPLTGLIIASTLVLPTRKLADLSIKSVVKRFKEPRFAAGANREAIKSIEEVGLTLEQFIGLGLRAMQAIAIDLEF